MKKISIIILNWNSYKDTIKCLESINGIKEEHFTLKTIVVDNNSSEKSIEDVKTLYPKTDLIINPKNLGFSGGNNIGIKHALNIGSDDIFLLNSDTLLDKQVIDGILKTQQEFNADLISPKIYFTKGFEFHKKRYQKSDLGNVIWFAGGKIDWGNIIGSHIGVDEVDKGQFNQDKEIDFATGAAMFISKKVFKKIGFFAEEYFLYYEDLDFSIRAKQAGLKVYYSSGGFLFHNNAGSSFSGSSLQDYYISRNRLLFGLKYAPILSKFALIRESLKILKQGRINQKKGIKDFYLRKLGKGSYE